MSIFGKVLAVLNVLAAAAFVFLATQTRGTRHAWALTAWHHQRALEGQPLNNDEKDLDGSPLARKPTDDTLRVIFPDGPVRTLEEEANRRKDIVLGEIRQGTDDLAQRRKLDQLALLLARTGAELDEIRREIWEQKDKKYVRSVEELTGSQGPIERLFSDALNPQLNADARRQAIAYLLIGLAEVPGDLNATEQNLRRVYNVVGVRHYTRAMEEHALNLRQMGQRVRELTAQDQGDFVIQHDAVVRQLLAMAEHIEDLRRHVRLLGEQKAENYEVLVAARKKDLDELTTELTTLTAAKNKEMSRQTGLEKQLFGLQRKLGEAAEKNQRLEQDIRKLELER